MKEKILLTENLDGRRSLLFPILFSFLGLLVIAQIGLYLWSYLSPQADNRPVQTNQSAGSVEATASATPVVAGTMSDLSGLTIEIRTIASSSALLSEIPQDCSLYYKYQEVMVREADLVDRGRIVIPNLKALIEADINSRAEVISDNESDVHFEEIAPLSGQDCADYDIDILARDRTAGVVYLYTRIYYDSDAPYSGLDYIYRLDLKNKSIQRLTESSDALSRFEAYRGLASDSYSILADNHRVLKWNSRGIYLVNLADDSVRAVYQAPVGQWLVSAMDFMMGYSASYDVKVSGSFVTFGLYDKKTTAGGKPLALNERDGDFEPDIPEAEWGDSVYPKFISRQTIAIPQE